jgi:hypothetical protein
LKLNLDAEPRALSTLLTFLLFLGLVFAAGALAPTLDQILGWTPK